MRKLVSGLVSASGGSAGLTLASEARSGEAVGAEYIAGAVIRKLGSGLLSASGGSVKLPPTSETGGGDAGTRGSVRKLESGFKSGSGKSEELPPPSEPSRGETGEGMANMGGSESRKLGSGFVSGSSGRSALGAAAPTDESEEKKSCISLRLGPIGSAAPFAPFPNEGAGAGAHAGVGLGSDGSLPSRPASGN